MKDIASFAELLTQNRPQSDPLQEKCPGEAIAPRFDLVPPGGCKRYRENRKAMGAIDSKVKTTQILGLCNVPQLEFHRVLYCLYFFRVDCFYSLACLRVMIIMCECRFYGSLTDGYRLSVQ